MMVARAKENKIELLVRYQDFNRRVGLVNNYCELEFLGLTGQDFSGAFRGRYLPQLVQFCKDNPDYHILSGDGPGRLVNRLILERNYYMIGDGDQDPALVLNYLLDPQWPVLAEDGISAALAELEHIKNRRKA